jgi:hypothetical protein
VTRSVTALALAFFVAVGADLASAAAPAVTPRWTHSATPSGENSAFYRDRGTELIFRCLGSSVELVLYVDLGRIDPNVRAQRTAYMGLIVDDNLYWFEGRLITDATTISIGAGGRAANDFAHYIANAARTVSTSVLTQPPGPGSLHYNYMEYPVEGAANAIKAAYAGCGIPY